MQRLYFFIIVFVVLSCGNKEEVVPLYIPSLMEIPKGFPEVLHPEGNEFTIQRWELGKKLFFDPIMSVDSMISCASCHKPALAFSDDVALSNGVADRPGTQNAPSLANITYHPYFTRAGGVPNLEQQILVPIQEHNEFDFNILLIAERLAADSLYVSLAQKAYDREPDAFVITRALSCFERSLLSGYSPYDQYTQYDNSDAMSEAAIRGMDLFFSEKTNCSNCHNGFNFSDYAFANNGLYENYEDSGRFRLTGNEEDRALFKVPSLRNIALTAPYMHNGSINSLEEVIQHYQTGGKSHPHKSPLIKSLSLSQEEQNDLLQFLNALSDESFINSPLFAE